jgi:hypothetical protein
VHGSEPMAGSNPEACRFRKFNTKFRKKRGVL